jgi:A/G-specific adenine glycosylase
MKDAFANHLLPWYRAQGRPLPWRKTHDPYHIWLSEVILQQTRVEQGRGYWERFVERWPTVKDLAEATEDEVLKQWQGLGYYSRARNLLTAARQVMNEHDGQFPRSHAALLTLKGVGDYTAAAIASICFNGPDAVVDGNVYRVLSRVFGIDTPIDSTEGRKRFKELAQHLLDIRHPGDHNQAVMELGAMVCTPKNYACMLCPLQPQCAAFATGRIDELPVKAGTTKVRDRFFNYLHIRTEKGFYVQQRTGKGIWQGLFELPLIESEQPLKKNALIERSAEMDGTGWIVIGKSEEVKHVLSHQIIHAVFWEVVPPKDFVAPNTWTDVPLGRINEFAVPRLIERWLEGIGLRMRSVLLAGLAPGGPRGRNRAIGSHGQQG